MNKQDLAKDYLDKLYALFQELLKVERESKLEERERIYAHNQTRLERVIQNYFKKLRPLDD